MLTSLVWITQILKLLYLLEKGFDCKTIISTDIKSKKYYIQDELRFDLFPLNSTKYQDKMKVVEFLKSKGIDYRKVPIPEYVIKEAQKLYPNNWQEYLEKY